jgi:hypothetical protein
MSFKRLAVFMMCLMATCAFAPAAFAQMDLTSSGSARQVITQDLPSTVQTAQVARPDFRMMGLALLWVNTPWMSSMPMALPETLMPISSADRRWRFR